MSKTLTNYLAAGLLIFMLALAFGSMRGDSAIMDEVAHLPAGYSYISQGDMRINPEHPPLIKDLAGGAVWLYSKITGQPINFPSQIAAWQSDVNGQWDFGFDFMYKEGNNADLMLLLGRLPMLLILLLLGFYVFKWTSELAGSGAALLALFLFCFSPTFIAHGRFVTTDVAAAAAIFIASYYFIRYLKHPNWKNLIVAGLVFGVAQLAKFSAFLLVPLFGVVALVWLVLKILEETDRGQKTSTDSWPLTWRYLGGTILLMAIGCVFVIWPVYGCHVINYPVARQQSDTQYILSTFGMRPLANFIYWLAGIPFLRALAQYGLGLTMVVQRAAGGNTIYYMDQVYNLGFKSYFPFVYLVKETLTLHILTLTAIFLALTAFFKKHFYRFKNFRRLLEENIAQVLMLCFIALYWYMSLRSPLNIGVRHILPTFAFIFVMVASQVARWQKRLAVEYLVLKRERLFPGIRAALIASFSIVALLLAWQAVSVISVYPSFLAYFNELAGGPANGYKYVTDSNLDWGQDMKRLADWVEKNNIDKIYVDFFGGSMPSYYLGDKYLPWWGQRSPQDLSATGGYLAVSATFLQGGRGQAIKGFNETTGYYRWLDAFEPVAVIGHSIFVYYLPPGASSLTQ